MLCDRAACGCVENEQRSGQLRADSDPLAIRTQRGGTRAFHRDRSPLPAESLSSRSRPGGRSKTSWPCLTMADDGQRQTIGRQSRDLPQAAIANF